VKIVIEEYLLNSNQWLDGNHISIFQNLLHDLVNSKVLYPQFCGFKHPNVFLSYKRDIVFNNTHNLQQLVQVVHVYNHLVLITDYNP
jgi:hypothetical protein